VDYGIDGVKWNAMMLVMIVLKIEFSRDLGGSSALSAFSLFS
jgi:hypothetical protein